MALRKECAVVEPDLLELLPVGGSHGDPRADRLPIPRLANQPHLQPVIGVVAKIAIRSQVPRKSILRIPVKLFPPSPEGEILQRRQNEIAPTVVVQVGPGRYGSHVLVRRQRQQSCRLETVVATLPEQSLRNGI